MKRNCNQCHYQLMEKLIAMSAKLSKLSNFKVKLTFSQLIRVVLKEKNFKSNKSESSHVWKEKFFENIHTSDPFKSWSIEMTN